MIAQYLQLAPLRANADVAMPVYPSHRDELCYHLHALEPYIENGGWLRSIGWLTFAMLRWCWRESAWIWKVK